jgi:hypothetical protein
MPYRKQEFVEVYDKLADIIDVDDSRGRSVPVNMNFIEEGFLSKDTGSEYQGATDDTVESHSPVYYKKKDGTEFQIQAKGTKLQALNTTTGLYEDISGSPTFTDGARFGWKVYDNELYGCNGVENYFKFDGTDFTEYASAPKGNVLEVFEDRMFVTGVTDEPLSIYYTDAGTVTTFPSANVLQPLGTDRVNALVNYFGTLLIFKDDSIWKLTFVYDQVVALFLPKLEVQSGNYGCPSRKGVTWVENDIWFFTGQEVRSIGYQDQQIGILGINNSVISENIKETLRNIPFERFAQCAVFYENRRFYLSVPLANDYNDTTFVCHTLHQNNWTKYANRIKAESQDYFEIEGEVYSAKSSAPYGIVKWNEDLLDDDSDSFACEVFFDRIEDKDFNKFTFYRYLDLQFKDLNARVKVVVRTDRNDGRTVSEREFLVGSDPINDGLPLGLVPFGSLLFGDSYGFTLELSPFQKRRVSFLEKGQAITIGLVHDNPGETFTLVQMAVSGHRKPRKMFKPSNILSV